MRCQSVRNSHGDITLKSRVMHRYSTNYKMKEWYTMEIKFKNRRVVSRLSRYKNTLYRFKKLGFEKVFSDYLAEEVGVTSSQVRKDFSIFGITGNKRAGYKIDELLKSLEALFYKDQIQKVVIVGAGRLGMALSNYNGFLSNNIEVIAAFDIDPAKQSMSTTPKIYPLSKLEEIVKEQGVEIGVIAVPELVAEETYETLKKVGIKGVLNFAPMPLKSTETCIVTTYCVEVEIENLIYYVKERANSEK